MNENQIKAQALREAAQIVRDHGSTGGTIDAATVVWDLEDAAEALEGK